jgi:quercetin dioxygenase-like cupin family protein
MQTVDVYSVPLARGAFASDPTVRFRANFALHGGKGLQQSSVVLIDIQPGKALGEHADSPEQVLLVLEGEIELTIGGERLRAGRGMMAVVPPSTPHSMRNVGDSPARVVGFFPSATVVSTFAEPIHPQGDRVLVFGDRAYRERIPEFRAAGRPVPR